MKRLALFVFLTLVTACGGGGGGSSSSSSSSSSSETSMTGTYTFIFGFQGTSYIKSVSIGSSNGSVDPTSGNPIYSGASDTGAGYLGTYCTTCYTYAGATLNKYIWTALGASDGMEYLYLFKVEGDKRLTGWVCRGLALYSSYPTLPDFSGTMQNQDNCAVLDSTWSVMQ